MRITVAKRVALACAWPKGLTDREAEVIRLVARGRTNKEIAALLDVSPKTVQHHVAHAYDKIGVESRAGAALFATEAGLLARRVLTAAMDRSAR